MTTNLATTCSAVLWAAVVIAGSIAAGCGGGGGGGGGASPVASALVPDGARSTLAVTPASIVADGIDAATVRVTARDPSGAPLADLAVTFRVSGAGGVSLTPTTVRTGANGVALSTLRGTTAGSASVRATASGVTLGNQVTVALTSPPPPPGPSAPANLTATASGPTSVGLAWTDTSTDEDVFTIERRRSGGLFSEIAEVGSNTTVFDDFGLEPASAYEWRVVARRAGAASASSPAFATTPPMAPPSVSFADPGLGTARGVTDVRFDLTQAQGLRCDVLVEFDPGTGVFQRATQAGAAPGEASGLDRLVASASGTRHVFRWNTEADFPPGSVSNVRLRLTPNVRGLAGTSVLNTSISVYDHDLTSAPGVVLSSNSGCSAADLDQDGIIDLIAHRSGGGAGTIGVKRGLGNLTYAPVVRYPGSTSISSVVVSDLDGDGLPDVAVSGSSPGTLTIWLNAGAGTLLPPVTTPLGGSRPFGMIAADFDGDGDQDLAMVEEAGPLVILENQGAATFSVLSSQASGATPSALTAGDIDVDGDQDLVVVATDDDAALVWLNDGAAGFTLSATIAVGDGPLGVALGDLDLDGDLDLAVTGSLSNDVAVALNQAGSFGAASLTACGRFPTAVLILDMDRDGLPDVALSAAGDRKVDVLAGRGDGTLGARTSLDVSDFSFTLVASDMDGDGYDDLVTGSDGLSGISFVFQSRRRQVVRFDAPTLATLPFTPRDVALGDVNGDGKPDVIATSALGGVQADLGWGDGTFERRPMLVTSAFDEALSAADIDRDGMTDVATVSSTAGLVHVLWGSVTQPTSAVTDVPVAGGPVDVVLGDLDGDGRDELVVACRADDAVAVVRSRPGRTFGAARQTACGVHPEHVALADVDGDGRLDVVVALEGVASVIVLRNLGGAMLAPAQSFACGRVPMDLAVADVDGDGLDDVVVAGAGAQDVALLRATGGGALGPPTTLPVGVAARAVALSDVDRDGNVDVLVTAGTSGTMAVLRGTGGGAFALPQVTSLGVEVGALAVGDMDQDGHADAVTCLPSAYAAAVVRTVAGVPATPFQAATGLQPASLALADLDGDADLDAVIASVGSGVEVHLGGAGGTFAPGVTRSLGGATPVALAARDLDQDGDVDVAVAVFGVTGHIAVLSGDGAGGLTSPVVVACGGPPTHVVAADVDRDGLVDLVASVPSLDGVTVMSGLGGGAFSAPTLLSCGGPAREASVGDVNGDGRPDLAVHVLTEVVVLLQTAGGAFTAGPRLSVTLGAADIDVGRLLPGGPEHVYSLNANGNVELFLSEGGGAFGALTTLLGAIIGGDELVLADVDLDGRRDLVAAGDVGAMVAVRLARGDDRLEPDPLHWAVGGASAVAVGDVDGDGRPDLVALDRDGARLIVLRRR